MTKTVIPAQPSEQVTEESIQKAWTECKATEGAGIEFGRLCALYRDQHGAQGSKGQGLAAMLKRLGIKEGKAFYWIAEYEFSMGCAHNACPHCAEGFPSKRKLKQHLHKKHTELFTAPKAPPAEMCGVCVEYPHQVNELPTDYSKHPEMQAQSGGRGHGMALTRWRDVAKDKGYKLGCKDDDFVLTKGGKEINLGSKESALREFLTGADEMCPNCTMHPHLLSEKPVDGNEHWTVKPENHKYKTCKGCGEEVRYGKGHSESCPKVEPEPAEEEPKKKLGNSVELRKIAAWHKTPMGSLIHKVEVLLPSYSDGAEHVAVTLLEELTASSKDYSNMSKGEEFEMVCLLRGLEELSAACMKYAKRLRAKGIKMGNE